MAQLVRNRILVQQTAGSGAFETAQAAGATPIVIPVLFLLHRRSRSHLSDWALYGFAASPGPAFVTSLAAEQCAPHLTVDRPLAGH